MRAVRRSKFYVAKWVSVAVFDPRHHDRDRNPRADGEKISMDQLTAVRIQTVRDHMRLECEGDWDGVIATFNHPRYELYGAGTVFDGEAAVRGYFAASRIPFPIRPMKSLPSAPKATLCWLNFG